MLYDQIAGELQPNLHACSWPLQDVVSELASTAPLSITFRSPRGLALAASGRFRVRECHLHLESRADMPDLKQAPALCACLRSITLNHWAAVTEEVLEIIKKGCEEEGVTSLIKAHM